MEIFEDIILVSHPDARVATNYTISMDDGHACINAWDIFRPMVPFMEVGQRVLMMLYMGRNGNYLFVCRVPHIDATF